MLSLPSLARMETIPASLFVDVVLDTLVSSGSHSVHGADPSVTLCAAAMQLVLALSHTRGVSVAQLSALRSSIRGRHPSDCVGEHNASGAVRCDGGVR